MGDMLWFLPVADLTVFDWTLLIASALLVGFAKTAVGGVGAIAVAIFAAVLPAKESTGALLPLLLVGDVVAVRTYRAHAEWRLLLRLIPSVAGGVVLGFAFMAAVDDTVMRRTIGALLLLLVAVHLRRRRQRAEPGTAESPGRHIRTQVFGLLAGFTTMVANAGGSVMALYLLSAGLGMLGFLGTTAWFFFVLNMFKVPFSAGLGLISPGSLLMDAALAPAVVVGALLGRVGVRRLNQDQFERLVLVFTVISSINLLR